MSELAFGKNGHLHMRSHVQCPLELSLHPLEHVGVEVVVHLHPSQLSSPDLHSRTNCVTHWQLGSYRVASLGQVGSSLPVHRALSGESELPRGQVAGMSMVHWQEALLSVKPLGH